MCYGEKTLLTSDNVDDYNYCVLNRINVLNGILLDKQTECIITFRTYLKYKYEQVRIAIEHEIKFQNCGINYGNTE